MTQQRGPVFLERESYRRRRIMDGARMLPAVFLVLILLPVLWSDGSGKNIAAEAVYLFVLWCIFILVAAVLSRPLRAGLKRERPAAEPPGATRGGGVAPSPPEPPR